MTEQRLYDLKPGDTVVIEEYEFDDEKWVTGKIERVTKTQIIINEFDRFNRDTGRQIGGGWNRHDIYVPTPELLEKVRQTARADMLNRLVGEIRRTDARIMVRVPEETLRAFIEAIDAVKYGDGGK